MAPEMEPIINVSDGGMSCNNDIYSRLGTIIEIPTGAKVGARWHILGGPQGSSDPDNPIVISHQGLIQVYLVKVSHIASSGTRGLSWFKIASDGLNGGKWENMVANNEWTYFKMPTCIAPETT